MRLWCVLGVVTLGVLQGDAADTPSPSDYASKYAWIDFDTLTSSPRFLTGYIKCLLRKGPCSPEGRILRRLLPEIVATDCARCSPEQVNLARSLVQYIQQNRMDEYRLLQNLYDPKGIHQVHFLEFVNGRPPPVFVESSQINQRSTPPTTTSTTLPPEPPSTTLIARPPPPITRPPPPITSPPPPITRSPSPITPPPPAPSTLPPAPVITQPSSRPPASLTTRPPSPPTPQPSPPPPTTRPPTITTFQTQPPLAYPTTQRVLDSIQPNNNNIPGDSLSGSIFVRATSNAQSNVNQIQPSSNNMPSISSTILPPFYVKFESPLLNIFSELKLGIRQAAANLQVRLG